MLKEFDVIKVLEHLNVFTTIKSVHVESVQLSSLILSSHPFADRVWRKVRIFSRIIHENPNSRIFALT